MPDFKLPEYFMSAARFALRAMPEMKDRQRPYDLDDFRNTVEQGRHPDGEEVKADMPRWQMSDADLADLFAFLKALPD